MAQSHGRSGPTDSRFVVFAANGWLWKVNVSTRSLERLCKLPDEAPPVPFVTGAWNDGVVVFSIGPGGLFRVPATGGDVQKLTSLDAARKDNYHSWPQLLPGGRLLAFVRTEDPKTTGMYAGSLDAPTLEQVIASASRAVYASGSLLWTIDDRLVAQPFDPSRLTLSGQPATVVPSIFNGAGRTTSFWPSAAGSLAYVSGGSTRRQFKWFSRGGNPLDDVGAPGDYVSFDLSPDGARIATEVRREGTRTFSTIQVLDAARTISTSLTAGEMNDTDPRIGPDGDVAFARNTGEGTGIVRSDIAGGAVSVLVPKGKVSVVWLEDWAGPKGGVIFRTSGSPDAMQLAPGSTEPKRLTRAKEPVEQVQLSPDGRWVAYNNADSGRAEVYLSPTSGSGQRWQVSDAGGVQGIWSADGRQLYYLGLDSALYVVDVQVVGDAPRPSKPRLLFRTPLPVISSVVEQYRVTGDGQRFLLCLPVTTVQREPLRVLLNWPAHVARRQ